MFAAEDIAANLMGGTHPQPFQRYGVECRRRICAAISIFHVASTGSQSMSLAGLAAAGILPELRWTERCHRALPIIDRPDPVRLVRLVN